MKAMIPLRQRPGCRFARLASALLIALLVCLANRQLAHAQTYTDIYEFDGADNGCCPSYSHILAQGRDGNLYGTALNGHVGDGIIFRITPSGGSAGFRILYNFDHTSVPTDGVSPRGGLTLGTDGKFYGTTRFGGSGPSNPSGTIFSITSVSTPTTPTLKTLYTFTGGSDGGRPLGPPVQGSDGNFYGTTDFGTAYKITPAGVFNSLGNLPGASDSPLI